MKARAKQRTFFNKQVEPNICVLEPISFTPRRARLPRHARRRPARRGRPSGTSSQHADTFGSLIQPDPELTARLSTPSADARRRWRPPQGRRDRAGASASCSQAEYLAPRYSVVVANPPYMGSEHGRVAGGVRSSSSYPDEQGRSLRDVHRACAATSSMMAAWSR